MGSPFVAHAISMDIKEYLNQLTDWDHRLRLEEIFQQICNAFPTLETRVAWKQPMFTDHGTFIISFSTAKNHISVAPELVAMKIFSKEISDAGYTQSSQLFRIKKTDSIDYALIFKIIEFNIADKAGCQTFWRKSGSGEKE